MHLSGLFYLERRGTPSADEYDEALRSRYPKYGRYRTRAQFVLELTLARKRTNRTLKELRIEDIGTPAALRCVFVGDLSMGDVDLQRNIVGQPAVDQSVSPAAKFFTPCPVLGLLFEDLFQSGSGKVFAPL
jgi:hypothetical protein